MAISRMACNMNVIPLRASRAVSIEDLKCKVLEIDGFNLLILLESLLSGGYVFKGRDGLYRDISSVHGTYKRVVETSNALTLVGNILKGLEVESVKWFLIYLFLIVEGLKKCLKSLVIRISSTGK